MPHDYEKGLYRYVSQCAAENIKDDVCLDLIIYPSIGTDDQKINHTKVGKLTDHTAGVVSNIDWNSYSYSF